MDLGRSNYDLFENGFEKKTYPKNNVKRQ